MLLKTFMAATGKLLSVLLSLSCAQPRGLRPFEFYDGVKYFSSQKREVLLYVA